jgi:hypothetical protein
MDSRPVSRSCVLRRNLDLIVLRERITPPDGHPLQRMAAAQGDTDPLPSSIDKRPYFSRRRLAFPARWGQGRGKSASRLLPGGKANMLFRAGSEGCHCSSCEKLPPGDHSSLDISGRPIWTRIRKSWIRRSGVLQAESAGWSSRLRR